MEKETIQDDFSQGAEILYCHMCGHKVISGSRFCNYCGSPLIEPNKSESTKRNEIKKPLHQENRTILSKIVIWSVIITLALHLYPGAKLTLSFIHHQTGNYYEALKNIHTTYYWGGLSTFAESKKSQLLKELYSAEVTKYRNKEYTVSGYESFRLLSESYLYKDSSKYAVLMEYRLFPGNYYVSEWGNKLSQLADFEDTADILLKSSVLIKEFLEGSWENEAGKTRFSMAPISDNHSVWYNLPCDDTTELENTYYKIENGIYYLCSDNSTKKKKALFHFSIIDKNTISVYCYSNNLAYTLHRE